MKHFAIGILSCAVAGMSIATASAATIYQDSFGRTGDLSGTTPTTDTGGATWNSVTGEYSTDGASANVSGPSGNSSKIAYLPFQAGTTGTYTLSATLTPTVGSGGDWLALGFTANDPADAPFYDGGTVNPQLWVFYRGSGQVGGTSNGSTTGTPGASDTFSLTLNAATGAYTVTDTSSLINGSGTLLSSQVGAIKYVGIAQYDTAVGSFSNFQLTGPSAAVPEPASLSLLGLGAVSLLARRRKA